METAATVQQQHITYELPLNDAIRICLRLENLFRQFKKTVTSTTELSTKNAMNALLKILEVTDRPDIKSKLSQILTQYTNALVQLNRSAQVDTIRLQKTLKRLNEQTNY